MIHPADALLTLIFLTVLLSLSSNRLLELIEIMAFQGILVSLAPFLLEKHSGLTGVSSVFLALMILIKGVIMPYFLYLAVRRVVIRREVEPIVGYHASIFIGLLLIILSSFLNDRLALADVVDNVLLLPAAFTTLASGLFLLMARRKAITQVIGYLMMENGIYLVGSGLAKQTHTQYLVEFGVLLDLLVGVMIMGIILSRINHAFDDVDTAYLGRLKD